MLCLSTAPERDLTEPVGNVGVGDVTQENHVGWGDPRVRAEVRTH